MTPKRVQMSRQHPWRPDNPDAVIVARPTRWGNPYRVGDVNGWTGMDIADRAEAVSVYAAEMQTMASFRPDWFDALIAEIRSELAGKDLACWCPLDQPCHADVLLELANPGWKP